MATGNPSQFDLNWQVLCQGQQQQRGGGRELPSSGGSPPPPSVASSSPPRHVLAHLSSSRHHSPNLFLSQKTRTRSPAASSSSTSPVTVPLATLISLTDHSSVMTDSCGSVTLSGAGVTMAPAEAQARGTGPENRVLNGCETGGEGGAVGGAKGGEGVGEARGERVQEVGWESASLLGTGTTHSATTTSQSLTSVPVKTSSPAGTQSGVLLTSSSSGAAFPADKSRAQPAANESKSDPPGFPSKSGRDEKREGDLAPASMGSRAKTHAMKACSPACAENFARLHQEVSETRDQMSALSVKMEEQASHISKLMEENRRYIRENGKLKKNRTRESHMLRSDSYEDPSHPMYGQADDLEDRVISLQVQNNDLNLSLAREKRKRREAEARLERDEGYIKRLEDSVQVLKGTRVVMDPSTYRQVAEAYIATRRTPARRPHTHTGVPGSADLVCDSSPDVSQSHQRLSHPSALSTYSSSYSSWPSSTSTSSSSPSHYPSQESQLSSAGTPTLARSRNGKTKKERGHNSQDLGRGGLAGGTTPTMNPWDYQQLLESLEDLDGASRGALS